MRKHCTALDCGLLFIHVLIARAGHTLPLPLTLLLHKDRDAAHKAVKDHIFLSHRSEDMFKTTSHLTNLIVDLLQGNGDPKVCFLYCEN